ncbi:hypothetical protein HNP37_000460 [Flavobacterium nitrogenifigens]|uniref:Uncharacterized protein n=2 Tax=Flavobacterium TaxID=237 RepID=A0A7W7ITT6_9FLAO|nr:MULTISPECIES: hypothetical protein [Flavobacterium]MBB4800421.1 hypothetical protein [Flavobacterium nitrogenifigens]MBB6385829.1 hypothetical protein [Flavobacterium notoginsengisoli]
MKNHKKKYILIAIFGLFLNISNLYSQNAKEQSIHNLFDNTVGIENLGISNGYAYKDPYNTIDGNNMYYISNDFRKGSVTYEGQTYFDVNLKYGLYKDELIFSPHGESKYSSISLIQDKTSAFTINGRNFVNLNKKVSPLPELTTGYYEVTALREGFNFYIKHFKKLENKTVDNKVYSNFIESNTYFIFYKNTYYTSNSKSEILKIFPNQKKQINDFYAMNRGIRKSDNDQFMINLLKHINASLLLTEK